MAKGDVFYISMEQILDDQPTMTELLKYVVVAQWFSLGSLLDLNIARLRACAGDLALVYDLWIQEKGRNATRRILLNTLRSTTMGLNNIAENYEDFLKTMVKSSDSSHDVNDGKKYSEATRIVSIDSDAAFLLLEVVQIAITQKEYAIPSYLGNKSSQPSSDMKQFRDEVFAGARHIVVLSGAGMSAESRIPTFVNNTWRTYKIPKLCNPKRFQANPSLVWEFYHFRRKLMHKKQPNSAHWAIAELERRLKPQGRTVTVITQNIDKLHQDAGSEDVIELHGNVWFIRCTKCGYIEENCTIPIVPALQDKGAPDVGAVDAQIPIEELPQCKKCCSLVRPHVILFGEKLDADVIKKAEEKLALCDLCLLVGTSSLVYPAASFAPKLAARGVPVAEFNLEETPVTKVLKYHFTGECGKTLPLAVAEHPTELLEQQPECLKRKQDKVSPSFDQKKKLFKEDSN